MKPLRIALFTDADVFAGTERHIADLAWGLKRSGAAVTIACPARSPLARIAASQDIPHFAVEKNGHADWRAVAALAQKLRSGEFDLVHAHNGRTACLAAAARALAGRGRLVFTQHFLEPAHLARTGLRGTLSRKAHRRMTRSCDRILAVSNAVHDAMAIRHPEVVQKIVVVPNGIRPPRAPRFLSPAIVRARLGIESDQFFIFCAARLEPEKDLSTLLSAMEQTVRFNPRAFCAIAGEGSQKPLLQAEIERRGLDRHVVLLGFRDDTGSLLRAANLVVLPSSAEPFGLALVEAMALGKPVAAARAGGAMEIVEEGSTGILFPPRDSAALAECILCFASNPDLAAYMGAAGRMRYLEAFTVERMVCSTLAAYALC